MNKKKKILIVDDEEAQIVLLTSYFENDYEVNSIDNGPETLKFIAQNRPDLILLDIMMPEIDGDDVCYNVKKSADTKDIKIVFISSMTEKDYIDRYGDIIADGFVNKLAGPEEIISTVKSLL